MHELAQDQAGAPQRVRWTLDEGLTLTEQVRFAPTTLGQASRAVVVVTNLRGAPLRLSELTLTPNSSARQELEQAQPWPREVTLARGESLTLPVRWRPIDLIADSAVVTMRTDRHDHATLTATLLAPPLASVKMTPSQLSFSATQRTLADARLVSVERVGDGPLLVSNIRVVGSAAEFFTLSFPDPEAPDDMTRDALTPPPPQQLTPGEHVLVRVAAAPGETRALAALHVESDGANIAAHYARLEARGPEPEPAPLPPEDDARRTCLRVEGAHQLDHARWELDFGVVTSQAGNSRVVTLVSCGSDPITLSGLTHSGSPAFSVSGLPAAPTLTLAPGQRLALGVGYQPASDELERATWRWIMVGRPHSLVMTGSLKLP